MRETALAPKVSVKVGVTGDGTVGKYTVGTVNNTTCVRLVSDGDVFVNFNLGSAATAVIDTNMFLPAGAPEYIDLSAYSGKGSVYISAIVASGVSANLYISVMEG